MKEWEEYQKVGDLLYQQNKIKEANEFWEIARDLREKLINPKFDINKYIEDIKKAKIINTNNKIKGE